MNGIGGKIPLLLALLIPTQLLAIENKMVGVLQDSGADQRPFILSGWVPHTPPSPSEVASWPKTISEAVNDLLAVMSEAFKDEVRNTKKEDLIQFHHGWGMGIRNAYGLWRGNDELIESACGRPCLTDTASMKIIEAVWAALQDHTDQSSEKIPNIEQK